MSDTKIIRWKGDKLWHSMEIDQELWELICVVTNWILDNPNAILKDSFGVERIEENGDIVLENIDEFYKYENWDVEMGIDIKAENKKTKDLFLEDVEAEWAKEESKKIEEEGETEEELLAQLAEALRKSKGLYSDKKKPGRKKKEKIIEEDIDDDFDNGDDEEDYKYC